MTMPNQVLIAAAFTSIIAFDAASAADGLKIGLIQPLSGSVAYNGQSVVEGAKLALKQINESGGVDGKMLELVIEDGQCAPANSVNAAEKLIQNDRVSVLIGAFCSSATAAVMPVAEKYEIPFVTGVSSKPDLTEMGNRYFFRAAETEAILAKAFAKILANDLDLKSVAYIGVNDDWGRGSIEEFTKDLSELGVENVLEDFFEHGTTDYYTLLTRIRSAAPDGIFVAAETQDGSILVKQAKELGLDMRIFGSGSWATEDFMQLTGAASEGIYAAVPYASTIEGEANQAFVKAYSDAYGKQPGKYGAAGYNTVNIVAEALERAGSTDAQKVREALLKTDYEAPNGTYKFTDKGQAYGFSAVLVQLENGQPKVIATAPVEVTGE